MIDAAHQPSLDMKQKPSKTSNGGEGRVLNFQRHRWTFSCDTAAARLSHQPTFLLGGRFPRAVRCRVMHNADRESVFVFTRRMRLSCTVKKRHKDALKNSSGQKHLGQYRFVGYRTVSTRKGIGFSLGREDELPTSESASKLVYRWAQRRRSSQRLTDSISRPMVANDSDSKTEHRSWLGYILTSLPARMPHVSIPYGGRSVFGFAIFSNSATRVEGRTTFLSFPNELLSLFGFGTE